MSDTLLKIAARACLATVLALSLNPGVPIAETKSKASAAEVAATQARRQDAEAATSAALLVPNANGLAILIDNAIVALSQANITGNYSVLHDLGSPDFQQTNPPQRLAEIFKSQRERNLNLTPLVLFQPKMKRPAIIDDKGVMRVAGFYDTQPLQVHFNLGFQAVNGAWRLYEIALWTTAQPQ